MIDLTRLPHGWFAPEDISRLYACAVEAPPGAFVEIGVYCGKSATVLFRTAPKRELWLFDNCADWGVNVRTWPSGEHVHPFNRALLDSDLPLIGPIALLHHDGDHHVAAVTRDLAQIGPAVVVGGFIVIHDWQQPNHDSAGVDKGWWDWPGHEDYEQVFACREQAAFKRIK